LDLVDGGDAARDVGVEAAGADQPAAFRVLGLHRGQLAHVECVHVLLAARDRLLERALDRLWNVEWD